MLELDDIQHYLLTRPHATIAQYNFITFRDAEGGRKWVNALLTTVGTAKVNFSKLKPTICVGLAWLLLLMVFANLALMKIRWHTFPEPFRQGMAARAQMLGDTGINHPDNWEDNITSEDLHAVVILFARDREEGNDV